jgi:myo-inositol-1(or 4)-monophosphatase
VEAAEAAGTLLRERRREELHVRAKGDAGDVVTKLDFESERIILDRIKAQFPDHRVFAEESGDSGGDGAWTWLVDPLDGTNNLAIGLSAYVVGIALCAYREPVVGVVHDPVMKQTWSAVRGKGTRGPAGAVLPGSRPAGRGRIVAWTQGHDVNRDDATARALKMVLDARVHRVLPLWAPLLSWTMLARGDIDGIVGYRAEAVDLPAGYLLATEAGMRVRTLDGHPFDERIGLGAEDRSFVAGPDENIDMLISLARKAKTLEPVVAEMVIPTAR